MSITAALVLPVVVEIEKGFRRARHGQRREYAPLVAVSAEQARPAEQ